MGGPAAAAVSVTGAVIGHVWWWGVWDRGLLRELGTAPGWMRALVGQGAPGPAGAGPGAGGVHVVPPRRLRDETAGHRWGSGQRLGGG